MLHPGKPATWKVWRDGYQRANYRLVAATIWFNILEIYQRSLSRVAIVTPPKKVAHYSTRSGFPYQTLDRCIYIFISINESITLLLVPGDIICSLYIRYIYLWKLAFLNNLIIIKTEVDLPRIWYLD
jgi:hypothetical protein